jgi:hypothetical protein
MGRIEKNLDEALDISVDEMLETTLDDDNADAYIADVHREIFNSSDNPNYEEDKEEIEKYNKRKRQIEEFKKTLESAKDIDNKSWAQQIIKNCTHNMLVAQKIALDEIEEDPMSKKISSFSELSNAITASVKTMVDIDNAEESLKQSGEKNILRRLEVESKLNILDGEGSSAKFGLGSGSMDEMLKLLDSENAPNE